MSTNFTKSPQCQTSYNFVHRFRELLHANRRINIDRQADTAKLTGVFLQLLVENAPRTHLENTSLQSYPYSLTKANNCSSNGKKAYLELWRNVVHEMGTGGLEIGY
jgi:hypothetical protein